MNDDDTVPSSKIPVLTHLPDPDDNDPSFSSAI